MQHIPDHELLLDADGELDAPRAREVHIHLQACPLCHTRQRSILDTLAGAAAAHLQRQIPHPEPARAAFLARLRSRAERRRFLAAAALAAALLLALYPFLPSRHTTFKPQASLTPGAVRPVALRTLCQIGAEAERPPIPNSVAMAVFRKYGIEDPQPRAYEVDYLIPPDLGGSADPGNLWPQPYKEGAWNASVKDALEDLLRTRVCDGSMALSTAQTEIATDWIAAYKKHFRTAKPLPDHVALNKDRPWE